MTAEEIVAEWGKNLSDHGRTELKIAILDHAEDWVSAEREACAKIADAYGDSASDHEAGAGLSIAEEIRARGK